MRSRYLNVWVDGLNTEINEIYICRCNEVNGAINWAVRSHRIWWKLGIRMAKMVAFIWIHDEGESEGGRRRQDGDVIAFRGPESARDFRLAERALRRRKEPAIWTIDVPSNETTRERKDYHVHYAIENTSKAVQTWHRNWRFHQRPNNRSLFIKDVATGVTETQDGYFGRSPTAGPSIWSSWRTGKVV